MICKNNKQSTSPHNNRSLCTFHFYSLCFLFAEHFPLKKVGRRQVGLLIEVVTSDFMYIIEFYKFRDTYYCSRDLVYT